jgi:YjjG family noncanonical pyrimidine nucleotidase
VARKFDLILFDADGTLFDFATSERVAFEACLEAALGAGNYAEAHRVYVELSGALWRQLEQGTITGHELLERRWHELSQRCQLEYSVSEISVAYVKELSRHAHEIEGALDICRALAVEHQLGIITNGFEAIQRPRLAASSLSPFFAFMVTSEAAGAAKPAPAVFERALELVGRPMSRERVLVVGDGLASDIAGGQRMGFTTCWFNPLGQPAPLELRPDFTVERLAQLADIVR